MITGDPLAATPGVVPIGAIVAWAKSLTGVPSIPPEFVECNGQTLALTGSPVNGQVIPNLNASGGGTQRFLRGATTSGGVGGNETHTHTVSKSTSVSGINGSSVEMVTDVTVNAASSLPSYYQVVWIMRVR
jgi:hypothetical protein